MLGLLLKKLFVGIESRLIAMVTEQGTGITREGLLVIRSKVEGMVEMLRCQCVGGDC